MRVDMTDPALDQEFAPGQQEPEITIESLLYQRYGADVLASRGINTIPRIEVGDRTVTLNGIECRPEEFLTLFFQARFKRSMEYKAKETAPGELKVYNQLDHSKSYTVINTDDGIVCQCQDYHNQLRCFQNHAPTWEAIGGQPRCKHIFRAAIQWNDGLILSVVPEKFIAHVLGVPLTSPASSPSPA